MDKGWEGAHEEQREDKKVTKQSEHESEAERHAGKEVI